MTKSASWSIVKTANSLADKAADMMQLEYFQRERLRVGVLSHFPAKFRGLIKDHKNPKPDTNGVYPFDIRPIASVCGSPIEKIDWIITQVLKQILPFLSHHLQKTENFLAHMRLVNRDLHSMSSNRIVSFSLDVVSLYPSIPILRAVDVVMSYIDKLFLNLDFFGIHVDLIKHMLKFVCLNYEIQFGKKIFLQVKGLPMGAHFAPLMASIYMDFVELQALKLIPSSIQPVSYHRYMDDINVVIIIPLDSHLNISKENIPDYYLNVFNSIDENIKFTLEFFPEPSDFSPFLDVQVRFSDFLGVFELSWYQKSLHSGNLVHFNANNSSKQKTDFISSRTVEIMKRCNSNHTIRDSLHKFYKQLLLNEYPVPIVDKFINRGINKFIRQFRVQKKFLYFSYNICIDFDPLITRDSISQDVVPFSVRLSQRNLVKLPFISDHLSTSFNKRFDCDLFKSLQFIQVHRKSRPLFSLSPPLFKKKFECITNCQFCTNMRVTAEKKNMKAFFNCQTRGVVYRLTCLHCTYCYIGSSTRPLSMRVREHNYSFLRGDGKSAVADHVKPGNCRAKDILRPTSCGIGRAFDHRVVGQHRIKDARFKLGIRLKLDYVLPNFSIEIIDRQMHPGLLKVTEKHFITTLKPQLNRTSS